MEEVKVRKVKSAKRISLKGKVGRQTSKRFISNKGKKSKVQIMPGKDYPEITTPSIKKPTITEKASPKSKRVGKKQKTWLPVIASTEGSEFSRSKRNLRKLANAIDPDSRTQSIKLSYVMRKCKVSWKDVKGKTPLNKKKKTVVLPPDPLEQYAENDGSGLSEDKVVDAVKALLVLLEDNKKKLFSDEGKDIYLQITSFKVPKTSPREIRVVLPHSLYPDSSDVCLFTSDLQKGRKVDHAPTLEHFKELLSEKGVTRISEVITLRQLKTEFDRYELKRALCNRFDMFLSDAKVCGHISHLLGKIFYDRKKVPVPIKLDAENLKERVERALYISSYRVHNKGTLFLLKVAHTLLTPEQICENIMAAVLSLSKNFPGGWDNVLQLMIKGAKTIPVPFYLSTMKDNTVNTPEIKPIRPKAFVNRTGELTGIGIVRVRPDGEVVVLERQKLDEIEREVIEREHQFRLERDMAKRRKKNAKAGKSEDDEDEAEIEFTEEDLWRSDSEGGGEEEESVLQTKLRRLEEGEVEYNNEAAEMEPNETEDGKENSHNKNAMRRPCINAIEAAYLEHRQLSQNVEDRKGKSKKRRN